jgi:cysteinyl-tRNA synthetase
MASDILGNNFDLHGGGFDLKFPHHDNEIAQAEAFWNNGQWVNYFLHAGHLHIKGLKMAKSLKNFITIRQALKEHSAAELRMMFLLQAWYKPMNFSDQTVGDAREKLRIIRSFFGNVGCVKRKDTLVQSQNWTPAEASLHASTVAMNDAVHKALCDNFNTPDAITAVLTTITEANKYMEAAAAAPNSFVLTKAARDVGAVLRVFGLVDGNDNVVLSGDGGAGADGDAVTPVVDVLVAFRDEVRNRSRGMAGAGPLLQACDRLRDEQLPVLGIRLEDSPDGPTKWKTQNPESLIREIQQRQEAAKENEIKKITNKLEQKISELEKWTKALESPDKIYKNEKYSAWDAEGVPTRMADGSEVSKTLGKTLKKEYGKAVDMQADLAKKGGPAYIEETKAEIAKLEQQLKGK